MFWSVPEVPMDSCIGCYSQNRDAWTQVGMYGKDVTVAMDTIIEKNLISREHLQLQILHGKKLVKLYELDKLQLDDYVSARIPLENWKEGPLKCSREKKELNCSWYHRKCGKKGGKT